MCHADAMSRLPLNDPERDEIPLPAEVKIFVTHIRLFAYYL